MELQRAKQDNLYDFETAFYKLLEIKFILVSLTKPKVNYTVTQLNCWLVSNSVVMIYNEIVKYEGE